MRAPRVRAALGDLVIARREKREERHEGEGGEEGRDVPFDVEDAEVAVQGTQEDHRDEAERGDEEEIERHPRRAQARGGHRRMRAEDADEQGGGQGQSRESGMWAGAQHGAESPRRAREDRRREDERRGDEHEEEHREELPAPDRGGGDRAREKERDPLLGRLPGDHRASEEDRERERERRGRHEGHQNPALGRVGFRPAVREGAGERHQPGREGDGEDEAPGRHLAREDGGEGSHPFLRGAVSPATATKISSRDREEDSASTTPSRDVKRANASSP
jgi:hypothetical protein